MSYYQGLNYVVIFVFRLFKEDALKTYQFLNYLSFKEFDDRFGKDLKGLLELLFLADKLMQKTNGLVWNKLYNSELTSIHFAVSCFMTVFTSTMKSESDLVTQVTKKIWDIFLTGGFLAVIKTLLFLIDQQKDNIYKLDSIELLMGIKNLETHPFHILVYIGIDPKIIELKLKRFNKSIINGYEIEESFFKRLMRHYQLIHKPILSFWGDEYSF